MELVLAALSQNVATSRRNEDIVMGRSVRSALAVLCVVGAYIGTVAPIAHADHAYLDGFWTHAPVVMSDGINDANVQDAAYYWQDRGFNGYVPPLPLYVGSEYCTASVYEGYVSVCTIPRAVLQPYCSKPPCDGTTHTFWYSGTNQMFSVYTLIADDLSAVRRQQVWRHELGHVIGLGHTTNYTGCVMLESADVPLGETCQHDRDMVGITMYPGGTW